MFSVGILYSVQEFLKFSYDNTLTVDQFSKETRFLLTSADLILQVSQECNWIKITSNGQIALTDRGTKIIEAIAAPLKLRLQLEDMISLHQPAWAMKIRHGRRETIVAMSDDVHQCFKESGLLDPWSDSIREWWDRAANLARARRSEKLGYTGRQAENWTCEYETKRTGQIPEWICLDSNFAGYDILSCASNTDKRPLRIEVKGSERRPKEAEFIVTRFEFQTAIASDHYIFHLWYVAPTRQLYVVPFSEISKHMPGDRSDGKWETTRIPYTPFGDYRVL